MEAEADVTVVESNNYFYGACYKIWEFRNGLVSWTVLRGNGHSEPSVGHRDQILQSAFLQIFSTARALQARMVLDGWGRTFFFFF